MISRKLAARALTLLPAVVIAVAAVVQVRAKAAVVRAEAQVAEPHAVTFLLADPAPRPVTARSHRRPPRAAM